MSVGFRGSSSLLSRGMGLVSKTSGPSASLRTQGTSGARLYTQIRQKSIRNLRQDRSVAITVPETFSFFSGGNRANSSSNSSGYTARVAAVGLGVGFSAFGFNFLNGGKTFPRAECESSALPTSFTSPSSSPDPSGPPPSSLVSPYQLTFGAVAGICSGVFVKKGARAIAFLLGGVFVLLQYLNTKNFISVDWRKASGAWDSTFGSKTAGEVGGAKRLPTIQGAWHWMVDFLTANFQQRASFLAGFALGIRLG